MRILLCNDDGIGAEGLDALVNELAPEHAVTVSAPLSQQSGKSHAMTVHAEVELLRGKAMQEKYRQYGVEAWAVAGTPVDSVKLYLEALVQVKPDVVISGINDGSNLATDILYSGTVGAAREAFLHGVPAFAVSRDYGSAWSFAEVAHAFHSFLMETMERRDGECFLYNVNFPKKHNPGPAKFVYGRQGVRDYLNAYNRIDRDGRIFYAVHGTPYDTDKSEPTDIYATEQGYVSVTPLKVDATDYEEMERELNR